MAFQVPPALIPPTGEFAGDEISAIILDPGSCTTRAGFSGEDIPKSVVPSFYGSLEAPNHAPKFYFGENSIHTPLPHVEILNPYSGDGVVEDWDKAAKLWEYTISTRLTGARPTKVEKNGLIDTANGGGDGDAMDVDVEATEGLEKFLSNNPLLVTEPGWTTPKHREKYIELAFEDWGCNAFYLGRSGVLASFGAGKPSSLVIDIGASTTSVTPVADGIMIKKGVMKSPLAGNFISEQIRQIFEQSQPPVPLTPHYMVKSKTPVDAGTPSQAIYRRFGAAPSASFRRLEEERVLTEFKESVVQVWSGPGRLSAGPVGTSNEDVARSYPGRPFEMPDGWNQVFGVERFKAAEALFDAKAVIRAADSPSKAVKEEQTIPAMVKAAIDSVDVELRPALLSNVVVVGGSSLLQGLTDRVNQELQTMYSAQRVRLNAPGNVAERKFASWIGGSILASLGTFHQLWISKKEYEEHGASIVEKRCR